MQHFASVVLLIADHLLEDRGSGCWFTIRQPGLMGAVCSRPTEMQHSLTLAFFSFLFFRLLYFLPSFLFLFRRSFIFFRSYFILLFLTFYLCLVSFFFICLYFYILFCSLLFSYFRSYVTDQELPYSGPASVMPFL
jgi:hypothetical protein